MSLLAQYEAQRAKLAPGMYRMPSTREERALAKAHDGLTAKERERFAAEVRAGDRLAVAVNDALTPIGRAESA